MEKHNQLEKDVRMTDSIPNCLVRVKYSFVANMDKIPNNREEAWLTGVLFDCPRIRRKRVVGIRTAHNQLDNPKLVDIVGITNFKGSTRKKQFQPIPLELNSVGVVSSGTSPIISIFWVDIQDGERPGLCDKDGEFIPAQTVTLPNNGIWTSTEDIALSEGSYAVLGVHQTTTALELVNIKARVRTSRTYHEGAVLEFEQRVVGQVNLEGSPIFDGMGHLVALGLFVGRLKSGEEGLVGMSIKHLAATYGHMIEGTI